MFRIFASCVLALGVTSAPVLAQASPAKEEKKEAPKAEKKKLSDAEVKKRLKEKKTTVAFEDMALKEALAALAKAADVEIKLDEDVASDDTVSVSMSDTSVESILNMIKESLDLTWEVKDGAVLVKKAQTR
ncbi:MAG: DUF4974 domain-containing protein [Planctomycetes bacterium]|nr:DUF4974 domain-containing protein [Planctomycetota bacterium]